MSIELAPYNIMVNSISPGAVDTTTIRSDMERQLMNRGISFEEVKRELMIQGAIKRSLDPNNVAPIILFLCSERATYITGVDFLVDGGWIS
jgi:3-oxoacyl-[acyl-carrier protein] reductase